MVKKKKVFAKFEIPEDVTVVRGVFLYETTGGPIGVMPYKGLNIASLKHIVAEASDHLMAQQIAKEVHERLMRQAFIDQMLVEKETDQEPTEQ